MSDTPLERSRRSAITQNGHTPVAYIMTFAMASLLDGQARLLPCRGPAPQLIDAAETRSFQEPAGRARAGRTLARDEHRLVLVLAELVEASGELSHRDIARPRHVPGCEFRGVAHVEHQMRPLVDEPRG